MRNAVTATVISCVIFSGGCSSGSPPAKNAAIDSVFKQMEKFLLAAYQESKKDDAAAGQNYSANLESIDIRSCPADFQQAFVRYKLAYIELNDYIAKRQGVGGKIRAFVEGAGAAWTGESPRTLTAEPDRLQGNVRKAQSELESIAIRYGVQMGFHK